MTARKPQNILFILSDDQGPWAMGCAGNPEIQTPNLDRLAATGMRFENFFCASPVCSPARATLLTGRIPSQHGVHDWIAAGDTIAKYEPKGNGQLIAYLAGQTGYTDILAKAGYRCGISGKWHLGDSHHPQKGLDYWRVHAKGGGPYYQAPMIQDGELYEEPAYVTDAITDNALDFLEQNRSSKQPFYLSVHYTAPHAPWSREHHPAEIYDDYYENCPFDSVPKVISPPEWVEIVSIPVDTDEKRRAYLSGYYAAVTAMDRNIGRLVDWLEAHNLRDDTLIVFTSDNGMNMGHHGVYGKGNATYPLNMFEESVKVPFIASSPKQIPQGTVNRDLVSQYDFMPTLLDYVGLENPLAEDLPGRSFKELLAGGNREDDSSIVVFDEYGPVHMIRNKEWKYVHRFLDGPNELYDLIKDPGEQHNLSGNDDYQRVEAEWRERLQEWFSRYVIEAYDGSVRQVTGSGQLGCCDEAVDGIPIFSTERVELILEKKRKGAK